MNLEAAIAADRAGEFESAAALYEEVLAAGDASLQVLLNLALLYWQVTDPGLAAGNHLPVNFFATAGHRIPALLAEAARLYPGSTAVTFWTRYIAWADLGEPLDIEECRVLLHEDPTVLAPAMYLFVSTYGREAATEARQLLQQCREEGTTGARYVVSVLEAAMRRTGRRT